MKSNCEQSRPVTPGGLRPDGVKSDPTALVGGHRNFELARQLDAGAKVTGQIRNKQSQAYQRMTGCGMNSRWDKVTSKRQCVAIGEHGARVPPIFSL